MARSYRRTADAANLLHKATGILHELDMTDDRAVWRAIGSMDFYIREALALLDQGASREGVEAYCAGAGTLDVLQDELPFEQA